MSSRPNQNQLQLLQLQRWTSGDRQVRTDGWWCADNGLRRQRREETTFQILHL